MKFLENSYITKETFEHIWSGAFGALSKNLQTLPRVDTFLIFENQWLK